MDKAILISNIRAELESRIQNLKADIESLKESRNNDTKSSAGDKYETGREMIQIELNKLESSLKQKNFELNEFESIDFTDVSDSIKKGSLVYTNEGIYFISIGLGKVVLEEAIVYAVSVQSPIGKALLNKKSDEKLNFQNRTINLIKIE